MSWCKIGIHSWGKVKQWIVDGKVVHASKCKKCGKVKSGAKS